MSALPRKPDGRADCSGRQMDLASFLGVAIDDICVDIVRADSIAVRVDLRTCMVAPWVALNLRVVVSELLRNALLHAYEPNEAGHVSVFLWRSGFATCLAVADAGAGFGAGPGGGIGRAQDAMARIGGRLIREPGFGTVWRGFVLDGAV